MVKVVIVDDHEIVRKGLRSILESDARFDVIGEAATGEEALKVISSTKPDVALVDIRMPGMSGVELCCRLSKTVPETAVIILTSYLENELVYECIRAGAKGYILKDIESLDLKRSILAVVQGEAVLDPKATSIVMEHLRKDEELGGLRPLSPKEMEILRLISQGLSNKEIAAKLFLSENTIKGYVQEILRKLGARNRIEAIMIALRRGLI
ncbi:MAG: DNA-binding response regulator [Chloroflexi bacterium]|nr:MAG: DNA-binding response regulator [Chloroflexota bacterium]HDN80099.1 response regulator transcription factor [Chloroflexota bacterium]